MRIQKHLSAITAAALIVTLCGCSALEGTASVAETDVAVAATDTSEVTIVDDTVGSIEDGITVTDTSSFSIKYKYWYDNPDVIQAQSELTPTGQTDTGELFLDKWTIYEDNEGNQYIMSGRTPVYLSEGKIASKDLYNYLRTQDTGERSYVATSSDFAERILAFDTALAEAEAEQPETYEDRVAAVDASIENPAQVRDVYVNNMKMSVTVASDDTLEISGLLNERQLGSILAADNGLDIYLFTAAGEIVINVSYDTDLMQYVFSYSTGEDAEPVSNEEMQITSDTTIVMSFDVIENYLGWDVEEYENFVNIVTDNKDIAKEENLVDRSANSLADYTRNSEDTTQPHGTPENDKLQEEYNEKWNIPTTTDDVLESVKATYENIGLKQPGTNPNGSSNDGNASTPTETVTSDGKYTIASTDLQNADGTYTQILGTSDVSVPAFVAETSANWTVESAARREGQSNPSKIPYSEITLENAAEAFPYLGYLGYDPDYIEVLETDDAYRIASKVWNNLAGNTAYEYFDEYNGPEISILDYPETIGHFFSSEAEYNAWYDEWQAELAEYEERAAITDAMIASGDYNLSYGITEEENQKLLAILQSKINGE